MIKVIIMRLLKSNYIWLILGILAFSFTRGDNPIELAVWLSPFLLLRFYRDVKLWKAVIFTLPLMVAVSLIIDKGMTPIPFNILIRLTVIKSSITLIPFIVDRLLSQSLQKSLKTLIFPVIAVSVEAFLISAFTGATWGNPAYGINNLPLLQFASIAGIWGLMFLIYWTASVANEVWEHRYQLGDIRKIAIVFMTILVTVYGFGLWRLHHEKPVENTVRVAGITPGPNYRAEMMEVFTKIFSTRRTGVFDEESIRTSSKIKYQYLLAESIKMAKSGVEIVAWSEGATFIFESDEETYIQKAVQSVREYNFSLGMGYMVISDNCQNFLKNNQSFIKNKLLFISSDGKIAWEYLKLNLAPGYEKMMTIPGDGILKTSNIEKGSVTGAICYDNDFPQYIRQAGTMKSDLLIDPSFDWPEIKNTHAKMARLRAIENGISLLRSTSTGISIAVDQYGNIKSSVDDIRSNGTPIVSVLPMRSVQTIYATLGDFCLWVCALGGIILVLLGSVRTWMRKY